MNMIETKASLRSASRPSPASLAILLALTSAARGQFYAVTDLGTLGGTNCIAYGINNHEQIVGTAQTGMGNYHGFMFDGRGMVDLGTMGGSNSWAYGMNDNGWMVGASGMPGTNMHAFVCTNALTNPVMMDLGTLGGSNSAAWMINHARRNGRVGGDERRQPPCVLHDQFPVGRHDGPGHTPGAQIPRRTASTATGWWSATR